MSTNVAIKALDRQDWLEPAAERTQAAVTATFEGAGEAGRVIKNFLHGTWLGHPLHPVLTDIPLGAWSTALVLDAMEEVTGRKEFGVGADAAVAIGLVGAAASAITGIADWQSTEGRARKVGLAHAILNTAGSLLYGTSLAMRKNGSRGAARGFSTLGFAAVAAAAYLGGHLVFGAKIGVDHTAGQTLPDRYKPVMPSDALAEGEMRRVDVDGTPVLLARRDDQVYAIADTCSHLGGPLSEGEFKDCTVTCPWHGSKFSVEDGRVIDGPATHPQPKLDVRIREGQIEVRLAHSV